MEMRFEVGREGSYERWFYVWPCMRWCREWYMECDGRFYRDGVEEERG